MSGRAAVMGLLLSLGAGACARAPDAEAGGPRAVPLGGQVLLHQGDEVVPIEEETVVGPGERVATGEDGRALVKLTGGRSLELGPQAEIRLDADRQPEVVRGSVLASSAASPVVVRAGDTEIEAQDAVFRVDRDFTVTLAVYRGQASLLGSGVAPVPSLRQATIVAGGAVPRGPQPLAVRPNDPWDTKLLGPAIDTGLDLVRLERGLARQLPQGDVPRAVAQALSGQFPRSAIDAALRRVRAAEAVVAAAVARYAARLAATPLAGALNRVLDLRREGAHWIVVVATWELARATLIRDLGRLTGLIARFVAPPAVTGGTATTAASSSSAPSGGTSGGSTPPAPSGSGGGGGSAAGPKPSGGSSGGGDAQDQPPPEPECTGVQCVIDDVIPGSAPPGP
jgi:ferric-dicitrate binding protein FerR (iron transport regulator)